MKFNFLCPFLYPCLLYSIVSFLLLLLLRRFFFAYFGFILHPRKEEEEIVHCKLPLLCSSYFKKKWWWSWYKEVSGKSIKVCPDDNMSLNNAPNLAIYMKIEKKCCRRHEKTINCDGKEISFACYEPRPFYWFLVSIERGCNFWSWGVS